MHIVRAKVEAAKVIQTAFRAWVVNGKPKPPPGRRKLSSYVSHTDKTHRRKPLHGGRQDTAVFKFDAALYGDDKNQQIAALTIQLAWRQYLRRRGPATTTLYNAKRRRPRPLQPNSPEVIKAKTTIRKIQEVHVYSHRQPMMQWRPRKKSPLLRAHVKIPKISITAFNLAFDTYFPPEVKARFAKQATSMAKSEADADSILAQIHLRRGKTSTSNSPSVSPPGRRTFLPDYARGKPVILAKLSVH